MGASIGRGGDPGRGKFSYASKVGQLEYSSTQLLGKLNEFIERMVFFYKFHT